MSLRQRGQRPSEATNEGGYYGGGSQPHGTPLPPNGMQTPQQVRRMSSQHSQDSAGSRYDYYNPAGHDVSPATPASYGQGPTSAATTVGQRARRPCANSPPPAYNFSNSLGAAGGSVAPRVLEGPGGGGGYGVYSGAGNAGGGGSLTHNPYQTSKSSQGVSFKHLFLGLLAITLLALTGAALHFRSVMNATEAELDSAREFLERRDWEEQQRSEERSSQGQDLGRHKNNDGAASAAEERAALKTEIAILRDQVVSQKQSHEELARIHAEKAAALESLQSKKQDLLKEIDHTKYQLEDTVEETAKYKAMLDGMEELDEYMKKREGALWRRIDALEGKIGRESWREAAEWFGTGPHKVELELEYPKATGPESEPSTWPLVRGKVLIEMAPLDLMPHAVNLFLQQVHHGLWEGCSVASNARHIIQFGPSYGNDGRAADSEHFERFRRRGLDRVSYQEYSDRYPHSRWTVGFAGRPGGPDFYVNKLDNSLIHGPGGQPNEHDLHNEADPCFGRVVAGINVLGEIDVIPMDSEGSNTVKYPVVVVRAKVMAPMENPAEGWREIRAGEKLDGQDEIMPLPEVTHGV